MRLLYTSCTFETKNVEEVLFLILFLLLSDLFCKNDTLLVDDPQKLLTKNQNWIYISPPYTSLKNVIFVRIL